MRDLNRRGVIAMLGGLAGWPVIANAKQVYRIGVLTGRSKQSPAFVAFFEELRQFGLLEGEHLDVDPRGFEAREDQFRSLAAELSASGVNLILCAGDAAIRAARATSARVLGISDDMVGAGFVRSLAHPEDITGISILSTELNAKRLELIMAAFQNARQVAVLSDPDITKPEHLNFLRNAAHSRGVEVSVYEAATPEAIVPAIEAASKAGAQAMNVLATPLFSFNSRRIVESATTLRLPAIYQWPETADEGGLLAYGPRITRIYQQLARQLIKLIRGVKPSDLPIEQPTLFELVVNLRAAHNMQLTVSGTFLTHADTVIE